MESDAMRDLQRLGQEFDGAPVPASIPSAACEFCDDGEGGSCFPQYGAAPHDCYWRKGPQFAIGQSTLIPPHEWTEAFIPDLEPDETWADFVYPVACGTYYCPKCHAEEYARKWADFVAKFGEPPASGIAAGLGPQS